ncbi:hypothetical protein [Streptomyces sp. NPDC005859]|uniref:hypothetical protein n=1 Tax=Streptomyces sp. NPDC005859 TaxID=3157170 RepID=UPI0033EBB827
MQRGEGQPRLKTNTTTSQDGEVRHGGSGHAFEQSVLPKPGGLGSPHIQGCPAALTSSVKDPVKGCLLQAPSVQVHFLESFMAAAAGALALPVFANFSVS